MGTPTYKDQDVRRFKLGKNKSQIAGESVTYSNPDWPQQTKVSENKNSKRKTALSVIEDIAGVPEESRSSHQDSDES